MKGLKELLSGRRSVRDYLSESISKELVEELLESACWAPSAHNRQPWRFYPLHAKKQKEDLAAAMGERLRQVRTWDGDDTGDIERDINRSYIRIATAPVALVVFTSIIDMDVYSDPKRNNDEYLMAVQSTAMAVQNLLIHAHWVGLAACWMCAPLFCQDVVTANLGTPPDWQAQALITLGRPNQFNLCKPRKPIRDVIWPRY